MTSYNKPMEPRNQNHEGLRLKEFRVSKNISQKEMAEILECSQPNLSKIERGELGISRNMLDKLLNQFIELNHNWILFGSGEMIRESLGERMITMEVNQDYNPDDFSIIEAQFKEFQILIDQGKIPLTAISLMFKNLRALLNAQQRLLAKYELREKIESMNKPIKPK